MTTGLILLTSISQLNSAQLTTLMAWGIEIKVVPNPGACCIHDESQHYQLANGLTRCSGCWDAMQHPYEAAYLTEQRPSPKQ